MGALKESAECFLLGDYQKGEFFLLELQKVAESLKKITHHPFFNLNKNPENFNEENGTDLVLLLLTWTPRFHKDFKGFEDSRENQESPGIHPDFKNRIKFRLSESYDDDQFRKFIFYLCKDYIKFIQGNSTERFPFLMGIPNLKSKSSSEFEPIQKIIDPEKQVELIKKVSLQILNDTSHIQKNHFKALIALIVKNDNFEPSLDDLQNYLTTQGLPHTPTALGITRRKTLNVIRGSIENFLGTQKEELTEELNHFLTRTEFFLPLMKRLIEDLES